MKPAIENEILKLGVDHEIGVIQSLVVKPLDEDLLGEKRLATPFKLRLQLPDYECNYSVENHSARIRLIDTRWIQFRSATPGGD